MIKSESKQIGLHLYTVEQLGAIRGREIFVRLVRLLGSSVDTIKGDAGAVLAKAAANFSELDMSAFCEAFAAKTDVTGGEYATAHPQLSNIFDVHFAGNYSELVEWLIFCFKVNFGSFFLGVGEKLKRPVPAAGNPTLPQTSEK
jgi:hypothetical protein